MRTQPEILENPETQDPRFASGMPHGSREIARKAMACLSRFRWAGRLAIAFYLGMIVLLALAYLAEPGAGTSFLILFSFVGFLGLLWYTSLFHQAFFDTLGGNTREENPLMLLFMGMPLYLLVYLRQEKRMKEALLRLLGENMQAAG